MANYLILLVGGNTLPNYIVARYLAEQETAKPDKVILISSAQMDEAKVTDTLKNVLETNLKLEVIRAFWQPHKTPYQLASEIASVFDKQSSNTVHLNYTGGTKQMVVCAIQALEGLSSRVITYLSYLDATDHILRYEGRNALPATGDLRKSVKLPLVELLGLHKSSGRVSEGYKEPQYLAVAEKLRALASGVEPGGRDFFCNTFRPWIQGHSFNGKLTSRSSGIRLDASELDDDLLDLLGQEFGPGAETWGDLDQPQQDFLLKGKWLIQSVLHKFISLKDQADPPVTDYGAGTRINKFEADLLILQGYHLTLVACTALGCQNCDIDLEERLRGKAFEALHWVEQLGGEEARVMLVTLADPPTARKLQDELKTSFGTGKSKIEVWSYRQLNGATFEDSFLTFLGA